MKRLRTVLSLLLALLVLLSFAAAEEPAEETAPAENAAAEEAPAAERADGTKTADGFTISLLDEYGCIIEDADDSVIADGILLIPKEIDGKTVCGFAPAVVKESVRLVIRPSNADVYCTDDNAPDTTLRYNTLIYAGFKDLSPDQMDRLPEMAKDEYALIEFYQTAVSRNGSVSWNYDGSTVLTPDEIPQELFGKKAYNLIDPSRVAQVDGDWIYTLDGDRASLRGYTGTGDRQFVIPEQVGGTYVQSYRLAVIPKEAEYVYIPIDCWASSVEAEDDGKHFIRVEYCSYDKAQQTNSWLLDNTPGFTADRIIVNNISESFVSGTDYRDNGFDRMLTADDLLPGIDGKQLVLDRVSWCIRYSEGDWTYTVEGDRAVLQTYSGTAEKNFVIPEKIGGVYVQSYKMAVIPKEAEYVYVPTDCWINAIDAAEDDGKQFTRIDYCSYEKAQQSYSWMLEDTPAFTEGTAAVSNISMMSVSGTECSDNGFNGLLSTGDLLSEIDGKKLILDRVSWYVAYAEGDWTYTVSGGDDPWVTLISYQGAAEDKLVIPSEIKGMRVENICYSVIPDSVKYVYVPYRGWFTYDERYDPNPSDKDFIYIRMITYEQAKQDYTWITDNNPTFTEGTLAVTEISRTQFNAAERNTNNGGTDGFIPSEELLTEIDGVPLNTVKVSEKLCYTSGDYTYSTDSDGNIYYISGAEAVDGKLMIPCMIDGKQVRGYYLSTLPEDVTEVFAPNYAYSRSYSNLDRKLIVYYYQDYDTIHSEEYISDNAMAVQPGEYLLIGGYIPDSSESLVREYYEYPTSFNGHKIHLSIYSDYIKQTTSGDYTYYKVSENEIVICAYAISEARKIEVPETLDGLTVVGISGLSYNRVFDNYDATDITIPDTVRIIGNNAIYNGKIKKITLPAGLKEIGSSALLLYNLSEINLPDGLESIGSSFVSSWRIKKLVVPESVTHISGGAFRSMNSLGSLQLPSGLTEIPNNLCENCDRLGTIAIPENVTVIRESAFSGCARLSKVTLSPSLKVIEKCAFVDCKSLKKLDLPDGLEEIGYQAFYGCKAIGQVTIPASVKKIDRFAFGECTGLAKVIFTDSVLEIADDAFQDCSKKLTFFAPEGSFAYNWAVEKGYNVKVAK